MMTKYLWKRGLGVLALVAAVGAGCKVTVNGRVHTLGVDDPNAKTEENGGKKTGDGSDVDSLAAEVAGAAKPGQTLTLKPDFSPNPTVLAGMTGKAEVSLSKHGADKCSGHVTAEPAALLQLPSSLKKVRLFAPGADVILAEIEGGKYVCDEIRTIGATPSVMLDEWPAGTIKIYAGGNQGRDLKYGIRIEDMQRPTDILWKDKVKPIEIAEIPKDPIIISEVTPKAPGFKTNCYKGFFREVPDVAFVLKRPLTDISIEVRAAKPVEVQLLTVPSDNGRDVKESCGGDQDRMSFNRMEAGMYALRIGTPTAEPQEILYHVIIRGKDTTRSPLQAPGKFAETITLEESVLAWHYPQLLTRDVEDKDASRESVFMSAPKQLFVFPKFNLDKSVATAVHKVGDKSYSNDDLPKNPPADEFPKENEPLLLLENNGYVMAADGSLFRVSMKDIQADPGGAVQVPATARNGTLPFWHAVDARGPEDEKAWLAYDKAVKDAKACEDRIWDAADKRIDALKASGWWPGQKTQIDNIADAADRQVDASCKKKDLVKKREQLQKDLEKTRTARRNVALAKVKTRVEGLFKQ